MNEQLTEKYARLIARVGANIEKGESVVIYAAAEIHKFAALLAKECYLAGAAEVRMEWSCSETEKLRYEYQTLRTLKKIPSWQTAKMRERTKKLPTRIHIISDAPDSLEGIDIKKFNAVRACTYAKFKKYFDTIEGMEKWVIAAFPSAAWAKAVFPGDSENDAYEKLLHGIFESVMVREDTDPIQEWKAHNEKIASRCEKLNKYKFDYLEYKSQNGTDLRVRLIPQTHWCGGGEYTKTGRFFNPNLPTEEIFISPAASGTEGKVVSTMPLSHNGQIIDKFYITFENGKAVDYHAEVGHELLKSIIETDEGAGMLGEAALVPQNNPIARMGILFYNTLFDENANCHLALGRGYIDTVDDYVHRTLDECRELGINESNVHVDFMIGAEDMSIVGYKDGKKIPIFKNGGFTEEFQ